jgi:hypothetical protein
MGFSIARCRPMGLVGTPISSPNPLNGLPLPFATHAALPIPIPLCRIHFTLPDRHPEATRPRRRRHGRTDPAIRTLSDICLRHDPGADPRPTAYSGRAAPSADRISDTLIECPGHHKKLQSMIRRQCCPHSRKARGRRVAELIARTGYSKIVRVGFITEPGKNPRPNKGAH